MNRIIIITVENKPGVLNRVTSLLRRRNFNIDSLTVAKTADPRFSRMTILLDGKHNPEQASKQLHKLIDVLKVWNFEIDDVIARESMLIKINLSQNTRGDLLRIAEMFRGEIVHTSEKMFIFFMTDSPEKIENALEAFKPFGIKEVVRSGAMAMAK